MFARDLRFCSNLRSHEGDPLPFELKTAVTEILWAGLAMMLIFEGLLPLLVPQAWRETMTRILLFKDGQLRFVGLASVVGGLVMLALVTA